MYIIDPLSTERARQYVPVVNTFRKIEKYHASLEKNRLSCKNSYRYLFNKTWHAPFAKKKKQEYIDFNIDNVDISYFCRM